MEGVSFLLFITNLEQLSSSSRYRHTRLLYIISNTLKNVADHLNRSNFISDKKYGFRFSRSIADLLSFQRISEALDSKDITREIALHILKSIVSHRVLLHKLSSYGISGRVFAVIKSFSYRSVKVVFNGQSSEAHEIKAGFFQRSLLGRNHFLLYINDLPENIPS